MSLLSSHEQEDLLARRSPQNRNVSCLPAPPPSLGSVLPTPPPSFIHQSLLRCRIRSSSCSRPPSPPVSCSHPRRLQCIVELRIHACLLQGQERRIIPRRMWYNKIMIYSGGCPRVFAARLCFRSHPQGERNERSSHRAGGRSARGWGGGETEGGREKGGGIRRRGPLLESLSGTRPSPTLVVLINGNSSAEPLLRRHGFPPPTIRNSGEAVFTSASLCPPGPPAEKDRLRSHLSLVSQ